MKSLKKAVKIILVLVLISTSFIVGFCVGVGDSLKATDGTYDIAIFDNGKVIITTKVKHVESYNNDLIIHGDSGEGINE